MQYSVTQFMSWVTRTTALAAATISMTRVFDFARKLASPVARTSSSSRMSGSTDGRDGEAEARPHPRRVGPQRRVDELAELRVLDDRRQQLAGHRVVEAEERAAEQDVVAPGQLLVEAGPEGQQAGHVAEDVDRSLRRAG